MTRPGKLPRDRALADLFASDADAAVLRVLRNAGKGLKAGEIRDSLHADGVSEAATERAWPALQRRIRAHEHVTVNPGHRYRWTGPLDDIAPMEALELLADGGLPAQERKALADIVREAIGGRPADLEWKSRVRQAEVDGIRLLAELASEVEQLVDNETQPPAMVRMVRAWVKRSGLEAVGRAGEEVRFDRKIHRPIGSPIRDGAKVIVVRPGYYWKSSDRDLLIGKAVVEE